MCVTHRDEFMVPREIKTYAIVLVALIAHHAPKGKVASLMWGFLKNCMYYFESSFVH